MNRTMFDSGEAGLAITKLMNGIPVLDHGYVKLIDCMGDDKTIVQAARCSIAGDNVKAVSDDRGLIRYLMRHRHTTPFETVMITVEMKLPIFVARQFVRHRTQALNEMSARYGELPEEFYVPEIEHINYQAEKNKQGRKDEVMKDAEMHRDAFRDAGSDSFVGYRRRLEYGMARELARINLPLSTYTKWWSTLSLHNLFHMLGLRLDSHAQYEARAYAEPLAEIAKTICPLAWEAFSDFRLNAMSLSASDIATLKELMYLLSKDLSKAGIAPLAALDEHFGGTVKSFKTKREHEEFLDKAKRLGLW